MERILRRGPVVRCRAMLLALAVVGGLASPLIAADLPEIATQASATEVFEGESLEYLVEIRNVKNPSPPTSWLSRPTLRWWRTGMSPEISRRPSSSTGG